MSEPAVLLMDGDCGLCTRSAVFLHPRLTDSNSMRFVAIESGGRSSLDFDLSREVSTSRLSVPDPKRPSLHALCRSGSMSPVPQMALQIPVPFCMDHSSANPRCCLPNRGKVPHEVLRSPGGLHFPLVISIVLAQCSSHC